MLPDIVVVVAVITGLMNERARATLTYVRPVGVFACN